jgi:ArsR family transcriptional regulator, arsenate/arsenite/antimonite-responsive transcriptional repressor
MKLMHSGNPPPAPTPAPALTQGQFDRIAKALADPRRVAVLEAIAREEYCPCQNLREQFPISKATMSHHIKELLRAGLIDARREGQYLHCQVRPHALEAYTAELLRRVGAGATAASLEREV